MAKYVDGFVLVIPKNKVAAYRKMASMGAKIWRKYGALEYKECMLEDAKPKGIVLTFPKLTKAKPSETVWFSFAVYKSRKHRDQVNKKVMAYWATLDMKDMPFDMKRMSFGGFNVEVEA
ncbi:DUF1428 domain-containing protein [Candidatus Parcubacteria bacterium]|nr:DUF1428 domain-containing protein [Candidatus Parcubacteria bacterium]